MLPLSSHYLNTMIVLYRPFSRQVAVMDAVDAAAAAAAAHALAIKRPKRESLRSFRMGISRASSIGTGRLSRGSVDTQPRRDSTHSRRFSSTGDELRPGTATSLASDPGFLEEEEEVNITCPF
jgi:hypothetical protein